MVLVHSRTQTQTQTQDQGTGTSDVHIHLLPDWSPSRMSALVQVAAIVKVMPGCVLDPATPVTVRFFDDAGQQVVTSSLALDADAGKLVGPAWQYLRGALVKIDDTVIAADAIVGSSRSTRRLRAEANQSVLLDPVPGHLGLPHEPHLWWRFSNHHHQPIAACDIIASTVIFLDGRALRPPPATYDGPACLPPGRTLSGLWSLEQLEPAALVGMHRLKVMIFGEQSRQFDYRWDGQAQPPQ